MLEAVKSKFVVYGGLFLACTGAAGNFLAIEPFHTLFYMFAWWAYIFLADSAVYALKGDSLIVSRTDEFLFLSVWSIFIWFLFELANVRLHNWSYVFVPSGQALRWSGYYLSYATVLPGIFETAELLTVWGIFKKAAVKPLPVTSVLLKRLTWAGAASLLLPLLLPRYFFALIWIAFTLLLEPVNYRLGLPSLLRELEKGDPRKLLYLLGGGAVCGFFWEFWNSLAGAKWVYTVPLVGNLKLFEMPVAGYIGFPVFGVECYVMYSTISFLRCGRWWEENAQEPLPGINPHPRLLIGAAVLLTIVFYATPLLIDHHTVRLFIGNL